MHVAALPTILRRVDPGQTTQVVQRYLDELAVAGGRTEADPLIRDLLARSVNRLHMLCASLLYRKYPRLTRGPLNLCPEEMLGAIVERLTKALRQVRPPTVRQFFAMVNCHVRWELNDLARQLDERLAALAPAPPCDDQVAAAGPDPSSAAATTPTARRILEALDRLPPDEREAFELVRIQGMTQPEAAAVIGCSAKTVKRRLHRGLALLSRELSDLVPRPGATA